MIITPLQTNYPDCLAGPDDDTGLGRTVDKLHVSTILHDIRQTIAPRNELDEGSLNDYAGGGWLWERIWDRAHADAICRGDIIRPGEFERDGIVGSPDAINLVTCRVLELKARWMSTAKWVNIERNFFFEIFQLKVYLGLIGYGEGWLEGELHVMFVNGDYRPPKPDTKSVLIEFTPREVRLAWDQIVGHATEKGWR